MDKSVVIKSNKNGLVLYMDASLPFKELKEKIRETFSKSKNFFGNAKMALTYEGRDLSNKEALEVLDIIADETDLEIVYVIDNSEANDKAYTNALRLLERELDEDVCEIYHGSVKERKCLNFKHSVVILGDVCENAEVHTDGSVFVLGSLFGNVFAGELGNVNAKVFAAFMKPQSVIIAEHAFKLPKEVKKGFFERIKDNEPPKSTGMLLSIVDDEIVINGELNA